MLSALPGAPRDSSVAELNPHAFNDAVLRSLGGRLRGMRTPCNCGVSEESAAVRTAAEMLGRKHTIKRLVSSRSGRAMLAAAVGLTLWSPTSDPAVARDSLAPSLAGQRWLPSEEWVTHHWLPYEERRLLSVLRISRAELLSWLRDDRHHTIEQLIRRGGLSVSLVAPRLVAPRETRVDPAQYERLLERTERTLTQGHLAQHVFFHYLHQAETKAHAWEIFGVSPSQFQRLRAAGFTPAEIGALRQRSRAFITDAITRVCRLSAAAGVRRGDTSARQAARFLSRQRRGVDAYLDQVLHAPRRQRLHLPPTVRRSVPTGRVLRAFLRAERRAASVLPVATRLNADPPSKVPTAVSSGFTVWPSAWLLIPPS